MNEHTATEIAYKNGYKKGVEDAVKKFLKKAMQEKFTHANFGELLCFEDIEKIANEILEDVNDDNLL